MKSIVGMHVLVAFALLCAGAHAAENGATISLLLYDSDTKQVLSRTAVSMYDGFDATLRYAGPYESVNAPYYLGTDTTTTDGFLKVDLSKLRNKVLFLQAGGYHKYIRHKRRQVVVVHYQRKTLSSEVTAYYAYDLETGVVTISRYADDAKDSIAKFTYIDVPMDY